jgi:hypothetical protein
MSAKAIWVEVNTGSMYRGDADSAKIICSLEEHFVPLYMNVSENKWGYALLLQKSLVH